METSECRFESQPLYCSECRAFIGEFGTCEDFAWCERCNSKSLPTLDADARSGHDLIYSSVDPDEALLISKIPR